MEHIERKIEGLRDECTKRTLAKEKSGYYTTKGARVGKAISELRTCLNVENMEKVRYLFSIVLDEDVPSPHAEMERFTMLVPFSNPNGHNYPLNKPFLAINATAGIRIDGHVGNHAPVFSGNMRYATHDEIIQYFSMVKRDLRVLGHFIASLDRFGLLT